tara:strand:- start:742 stop:1545 length:804 start_codon:yes stop_codon:yes gene_type:complete
MLTLYHNALSTCSQKVRMAFAEKQITFESELVDLVNGEQHDPEFVRLSPKHIVPVLVADGVAIRESTVIAEYVNTLTATPSLIPEAPLDQARMRMWVKRIDDDIHGKTSGVFTHAIWTRKAVGARSPEEIETYLAALPDEGERALRRDLIAKGVASAYLPGAIARMSTFINEMNTQLEQGRWLLGDQFTLADVAVMPYILRAQDTGFSGFWSHSRRSAVERWLNDIKARASFKTAVTDWTPDNMMDFLRSFAEDASEQIEHLIAAAP